MKLVITGCSGVVGQALIKQLRLNSSIRGLSCVDLRVVDRDLPSIRSADCLIHLGEPSLVNGCTRSDVEYCREVSEFWASLPNLERIIYLSSALIYDFTDGCPISEHTPIIAKSFYQRIKVNSERVFLSSTKQIQILRAGPMLSYSPRKVNILSDIFRQIDVQKRQQFVMLRDSRASAAFVALDDLVDALMCLLSSSKSGIFNCGGSTAISAGNLAKMTVQVNRLGSLVIQDNASSSLTGAPPSPLFLDTTKLSELGWRPRIGIEDALRANWQVYLGDKDGYG